MIASISCCLLTAAQVSRLQFLARDDAEVQQDPLQQVLFGEKRIQHERGERRSIDLFEQGAAERGLAGADVTGHDNEALAPSDGVLKQIERVGVRLAPVEVLRIRRQAERLFGKSVKIFVHGLIESSV